MRLGQPQDLYAPRDANARLSVQLAERACSRVPGPQVHGELATLRFDSDLRDDSMLTRGMVTCLRSHHALAAQLGDATRWLLVRDRAAGSFVASSMHEGFSDAITHVAKCEPACRSPVLFFLFVLDRGASIASHVLPAHLPSSTTEA